MQGHSTIVRQPAGHDAFPFIPAIILVWLLLLSPPVLAAAQDDTLPSINADSWLLVDHHSGHVIASHNAETRHHPAGLTKLMSVYIVFEHLSGGSLSPDSPVRVSVHAADAPGKQIFLKAEDVISASELIYGMIVQSANDATIALAETLAGSESGFVDLMNAKAYELGLVNTRFRNATGLSQKDHYSTASDIVRLARVLIRDYPDYYKWYSIKTFTHNGIKHHNRNALLWRDEAIDGIRASYDRSSGYHLAASGVRGDMRLIATVLGAPSERAQIEAGISLLNYGFNGYETRLLYRADTPATRVRVWMGNNSMLPVGISKDFYVTIPRGSTGSLQATLTIKDVQYAPKRPNEVLGTLNVYMGEEVIASRPLIALEEIKLGNPLQRALDRIQLWFY